MSSLKSQQFKLKPITMAVASAAAIMAGSSNFAVAQDQVEEEVIVRGIRASMAQSIDVKRNAVGVVDSINAEDMGKMPDTNLAESLQRVSGLSISRTNGEGSQVTIRGIDPALNMVTMNGRNMPTVTIDGTAGDKGSRAFDFANIASEVIYGVDVYKTGKADIATGGLGGTINIKTLRPLDVGETKGTIGVKAVQDSTVYNGSGSELTPELSGLYSWVNDEENFGVMLTGSYQERDNSRSNAFVNAWNIQTAGAATAGTSDGTLPDTATITNAPAAGEIYSMPTDLRYALEDNNRVRQNAQLAIQFRPVESVTATVDYTYSENDVSAERSQQSTWYNISAIDAATFDNDPVVKTPIIYSEAYDGGKDVSFAQQTFHSKTQNNSFGANLEWDVSDSVQLALDYHKSSASNVTDQAEAGLNANVVVANYADFSKDLPVMGIEIDDSDPTKGNDNGIVDGADMSGAMGTIAHDTQRTEIEQLRLLGSVELGGFAFFEDSNVSFGVESRKDSNHTLVGDGTAPRITMGNWGGVNPQNFGSDWPSYFTARDFGTAFPDFSSSTGDSHFLSNGLDADTAHIFERMEYMYAFGGDSANFNSFPNGKAQWNGVVGTNRFITEEATSVFAQFAGSFKIGEMDANLVAGVRFEDTDVTSSSVVQAPETMVWESDNDWSVLLKNGAPEVYAQDHSYSVALPNIDFDIAVTEDVKVRLSYSETIGRAGYGQLKSDVSIDNAYSLEASGGNPQLDPMRSSNIDLSVEYYFADDSFVSAGFFIKDVSDFIGTVSEERSHYGLTDPREGARNAAAIARIQNEGGNVNSEQDLHDAMLRNEGLDPADASTSIFSSSADDLAVFDTLLPGNDKSTTIDGIELAYTQWFGTSGFGLQANYTMVNADVEYDNTVIEGEQFVMPGLSDSMNIVGFYDANGIQARIAYNWRDEYLSDRNAGGGNPAYTEAFSQIDLSFSYDLNDNVTFTAEGINVTGEDSRVHGRSERQIYSLEDLGARYQVGVRYSF